LLWILIIGAIILFVVFFKKQPLRSFQWFCLMVFFLAATLRSRRFVEYFIPMAIIWSSIVFTWILNSPVFKRGWQSMQKSYTHHKKAWRALIIYLGIVIPFGMGNTLVNIKQELGRGFVINQFQAASQYLREHSQPGDILFHAQWDDWPILFYHNQQNNYIIGMDATFMYKHNPDNYRLWRDLGSGQIKENIGQIIKDDFHSRYIFIEKKEEDTKLFRAYVERDPMIKKIFDNEETCLYEIQ